MTGFIPGSRGSLMLDLVAVAMIAILPVVVIGVQMARRQKQFARHRSIMLTMSLILGVAVILFEVEMRMVGWRHLAEPSPYFDTYVPPALAIHLVCSVSTVITIIATIWNALRHFPTLPTPNHHSPLHKILGKISAIGLFLTSITGWIFYYLAFIASN
jgi:putative membrane protein